MYGNMYDNNVIQVESLNQIPFDDLISLYRQGYILGERSGNIRNNIRSLATCPSGVQIGSTMTLSATASSGTSPYTYIWSVKKPDGNIDTTLTGEINQYTFSQNGNYTISVYVTDSCVGGAKTSETQTCVVTVVSDSGGEVGCTSNANCSNGYCIGGKCYSKNTVYVAGAGLGLVALIVLSK